MRKLLLLLVLAYPLVSFAQRNDIYFVPKKDSKVIIVETDADKVVLLENEEPYSENVYTDDAYVYDEDDYRYSTRILRFRNSYSYVGSPLYWDLMYNCTYNGWSMYDNGYYIDIYPNYNNYWGWNSWSHRYWCDAWGYSPYYMSHYWNNHHHIHGGIHHSNIAQGSWRPSHKVHTNIPLRKGDRNTNVVTSNKRKDNDNIRAERGERIPVNRPNAQISNRVKTSVANEKASTVRREKDGNAPAVRRQQPQRTTAGNTNKKESSVRTQQPRRTSTSSASSKSEKTNSSDVGTRNNNERTTNYSTSSSSSRRNSYRSGNYSSGEYNRPSSTSVSRQRSFSSGGASMSGGARINAGARGGSLRK